MPTFSHIETGCTVDTLQVESVDRYTKLLGVHAGWQIVQVPDGTVDGSTPDGQGGYASPPPISPPALKPTEMGGVQFHTYCATVLAAVNKVSAQDGMARMGDIVKAMTLAANTSGGLVMIAYVRYIAAGNPGGKFTFSDIPTLMAALQAAGIVTAQEATGIVTGWPQQ